MSATGYKMLGYVVWRGAKWYVRKRIPPPRTIALAAGATAAGGVAVVAIARRLAG
jgi:hypothetical protein